MSSEATISAVGLGKSYRLFRQPADRLKEAVLRRQYGHDHWAVRDVGFELRRGETLGIIGRNGSGKSTLLQLVCGTLRPTTGTIEVRGRVAALLELGAGFNGEFTGRENVHLSASVLGLSDAEIAERLPAIEAFAGIGDFIDQPVRQYSSGMYARLAFAVCAHVDADILVIDEILAVGDAAFQQQCMRFLHSFRSRGTLLFVSHDEAAVLALCEQALWLDAGVMRDLGPAREVCRRYLGAVAGTAAAPGTFVAYEGTPAALPALRLQETRQGDFFDVDPDAEWPLQGGASIEGAGLYGPGGEPLEAAEGGEEVELRVTCRAERALARPLVGFLLRNPLGQNLFCGNTDACGAQALAIPADARFTAAFRFELPYLPTGDYAIEAMLFDAKASGFDALDRRRGAGYVHVTSSHISNGLANIVMQMTRLEILRDVSRPSVNPIDFFEFDPGAPWHGHGGATIETAAFYRPGGDRLQRAEGGDEVELRVLCRADRKIDRPIVGFLLRNPLGQTLFGDNTFNAYRLAPVAVAAGDRFTATFRFRLPYFLCGDHGLSLAITEGTQQDHIHVHWIERAITLRVTASPIRYGKIGVAMRGIKLALDAAPVASQA